MATRALGSTVHETSWMATRVWGAVSFLTRVSLITCPYGGTCNKGGKSVMKQDALARGMGYQGSP